VLIVNRRSWACKIINLIDFDIEREGDIVPDQFEMRLTDQVFDVPSRSGEKIIDAEDDRPVRQALAPLGRRRFRHFHRLLDPAGRFRLPDGCGEVHHRDQGINTDEVSGTHRRLIPSFATSQGQPATSANRYPPHQRHRRPGDLKQSEDDSV
jgi:hypothetical protein